MRHASRGETRRITAVMMPAMTISVPAAGSQLNMNVVDGDRVAAAR